VDGAAHLRRGHPSGVGEAVRAEPLFGRDGEGLASDACAGKLDREPDGLLGKRGEQPDVARALVDDAGAVGRGVSGVVRTVIGVPSQIISGAGRRVQRADTLVIGEECDPVADEHRVDQVRADRAEDVRERPGAGFVQPDLSAGPAAVPLPLGRVRAAAAQQNGPVTGDGGAPDGTVRQQAVCRAGQRDLVCPRTPRHAVRR
jgi:hypothetical protein